jgi:hypothetical protein
MVEELVNNTEQETQQEDTQQEQNTEATQQKQAQSDKEYNFRAIRERAEAAERRAQELERMIQANMSQNQPSQKIQVEEDDYGIDDDTYLEGRHFKKYAKTLKGELESTKKQLQEFQQQSSLTIAENRLKSQFNDFNKVVTKENLEKLASTKPHLYRSILSTQDMYDKGAAAYDIIKSAGLVKEEYKEEDKRLQDNRSKPRSAAGSPGQSADTPLTRVGDYDRRILTPERKEQLRRQVQQAKMYK